MSRQNLTLCALIILAIADPDGIVAQTPSSQAERRSQPPRSEATAPVPDGESKRLVTVTLWMLSITESQHPESGELEGALQDKATNLPTVIGSRKEVRDMIAKLKVAGLLKKAREIRLITEDGETATAQSGVDQPIIQATDMSDSGSVNTVAYRSMGTIVQATPLINGDGLIQVGLTCESTFAQESEDVVLARPADKDKAPIYATFIFREQNTTQTRIRSGNAMLVASDAKFGAAEEKRDVQTDLLILAAEIVSDAK